MYPLHVQSFRAREPEPGVRTIYARDGGNSKKGTEDDPVGTLDDVLALIDQFGHGSRRQIIDCTGFNPTGGPRSIAPLVGGRSEGLYLDSTVGSDQKINKCPIEWVATPTLVQPLTITGNVINPDTPKLSARLLTVAETLVPDAHVGQFVFADFFQYGVVIANTANTLVVQTYRGGDFTGAVGIYETSSTWAFGTPGDYYTGTLDYIAHCATSFAGIHFDTLDTKPWGIVLFPNMPTSFYACRLDHASFNQGRYVVADCCYFENGLVLDSTPFEIRAGLMANDEFLSHGDGAHGLAAFSDMTFRSVRNLGAGSSTSRTNIRYSYCLVEDSPTHGIKTMSPGITRVSACTIRNCALDAVHCYGGGGPTEIINTDGSGNGRYGIYLAAGAQAKIPANTTVTGASGDIRLGGAGVHSHAGTFPATDVGASDPEFCRVFR